MNPVFRCEFQQWVENIDHKKTELKLVSGYGKSLFVEGCQKQSVFFQKRSQLPCILFFVVRDKPHFSYSSEAFT